MLGNFSFKDFFDKKYDTVARRNAIITVTDKQAIASLTKSDEGYDDGYEDHYPSFYKFLNEIYELGLNKKTSLKKKAEIVEKYQEKLIMMRIITGKAGKKIWISMPKQISNNQLALLEVLRDKYDDELNEIIGEKNNEFIIITSPNNKYFSLKSFSEVVEYAKGLVDNNARIPQEKRIISRINNIIPRFGAKKR